MAAQILGSSTTTGTWPRVNLLPPEIAEKAALRKAQVAMVGVGLAAVAAVGVLTMNASAKVSEAEEAKADAVATGAKLQSDVRALQNVKDVYAQVDAARATLAGAMATEVLWSSYLHDMTLTIPENVWLTTYTVALQGAGATGGAAPGTAVLDPGLGTITIVGTAFSHNDVASWLESLAKQKGYANPYFTQSSEARIGSREVVNFTSTVTVTPASLANRYAKGITR